MTNDFNDCLNFSHSFEDHPIWPVVYNEAFPNMVEMVSYRKDGFWQREGVDRGILLETTKQVFIDEKVRGRNKITGDVYDDIALEYISNDKTGAPGWVCKPLRADYIAYLIAPLGVCYLLPVAQMQNAWSKYGDDWVDSYFKIKAKNNGYTTFSVGVPPNVLFAKMGNELRIWFKAFELET